MRILIVEDEMLLADSVCELLKRRGFEADTAYDGESGLQYAELGVYDLIILDVMLPGIEGSDVRIVTELRLGYHLEVRADD